MKFILLAMVSCLVLPGSDLSKTLFFYFYFNGMGLFICNSSYFPVFLLLLLFVIVKVRSRVGLHGNITSDTCEEFNRSSITGFTAALGFPNPRIATRVIVTKELRLRRPWVFTPVSISLIRKEVPSTCLSPTFPDLCCRRNDFNP